MSRSYLSRLLTHVGSKSNDILGVILLLYSLLFYVFTAVADVRYRTAAALHKACAL